jgi:hypothetical protein
MQITAHRTGGIAGRTERLGPVDSEEHGGKIEAKLEEIHFFDLQEQIPGGEGADIRSISILVSDPPRHHEVSFSETSELAREWGLFDLIELLESCGAKWEEVAVPTA